MVQGHSETVSETSVERVLVQSLHAAGELELRDEATSIISA